MDGVEYIGGLHKGDIVSVAIDGKSVLCELAEEPYSDTVRVRIAESGDERIVSFATVKDASPRYFE